MSVHKTVLPIIILSQFLCTSLWFAGNGVVNDLIQTFELSSNTLGYLTSAVQLGFILGTLAFAFLSISDRFSPSKIFFICALIGSFFNLGILFEWNTIYSLLLFRFLTGFCLAGIYPVGMKIASDYFKKGLGKSLGFLVGALVLGTALPHFLKLISASFNWQYIVVSTSALATVGGFLILLFVPNGPYFKKNSTPNFYDVFRVFKNSEFSSVAVGYFGHMWELYAFWTFTPVILTLYNTINPESNLSTPLFSFLIIGSGSLSCIFGGYLSEYLGVKKTATYFLSASTICCLFSPFIFNFSPIAFISFLIFWGMVVIADSPLFSTLIAKNTATETKGTALTIVNSIGFAITIISIQTLTYLLEFSATNYLFLILGIGPVFGILSLLKKQNSKTKA